MIRAVGWLHLQGAGAKAPVGVTARVTTTVPGPDYERQVRRAAEAGEPVPDIAPPDGYEMTAEFQAWLVDRMRDHVLAQVGGAGLDRMAIVKADTAEEELSEPQGETDGGPADGSSDEKTAA